MPRWKAVMAAALNVEELIERVPVREPRGVSWSVAKRSPLRLNARPTGNRIPVAMISRERKSGATRSMVPLAPKVKVRPAGAVDEIGVGEVAARCRSRRCRRDPR